MIEADRERDGKSSSGSGRSSAGSYPPIGPLGVVGDGHSLALFGPDAALEWFCPQRFDNAPLVWPLLDRQRGGRLCIGPVDDGAGARVQYVKNSAVLQYQWRSASGHAQAYVAMDWPPEEGQQRLLWWVQATWGEVEIQLECEPSFDFGRRELKVGPIAEGLLLTEPALQLALTASCPVRVEGNAIRGSVRLVAGESAGFCLSVPTVAGKAAEPLPPARIGERIERTLAAWHDWSGRIEWGGRYRESVVRSAVTLKLLIHEPTGAVVAAGTTSLPEALGGVRNWDYRYTWFRDASLTLNALFSLGCRREAHRWAEWMQQAVARHGMPLRVLYRVDGGVIPPEQSIPNLDGYRGSRPVRVGNAAESQLQLDLYGELLDCVFICESMGDATMREHWPHLRALADFIAAHWREADSGIWEVRDKPRHFVHSKATAWLGLQRAIWFKEKFDLEGNSARWRQEAQALRTQVLEQGVSADGSYLMRAYGEEAMDASLLRLAIGGFIDGDSELFRRTIETIQAELGAPGDIEGLLLRYLPDAGDGLPGGEGAFTVCSFWLVQALLLAGRQDEAEALFQRLLGLQGDLGLFGEEIDPASGQQLGNFPQAFTHIGLINAALRLRQRSRIASGEVACAKPGPTY